MLPPCLPTRGIITSWCAQPFLAKFYSGSLPATLMMCFKIESAGAMPILGRDPLSNHQSIYQSTSFIPPWHLPSRLFCYLLRWPAASCFPPKGKLLPLLPSAKATAPPEQSAHLLSTSEMILFDKQLLPQSRFPRHIQTFSSGKTHVQLYAIHPSFTVSTLSSTDISRPVFPHGFQQLRLLKGRPDTQGSVEKNRNQAPFPTVTQGY